MTTTRTDRGLVGQQRESRSVLLLPAGHRRVQGAHRRPICRRGVLRNVQARIASSCRSEAEQLREEVSMLRQQVQQLREPE